MYIRIYPTLLNYTVREEKVWRFGMHTWPKIINTSRNHRRCCRIIIRPTDRHRRRKPCVQNGSLFFFYHKTIGLGPNCLEEILEYFVKYYFVILNIKLIWYFFFRENLKSEPTYYVILYNLIVLNTFNDLKCL